MQGSVLLLASNYISKCRCIHSGYCSAISGRYVEIASVANGVQSAILQLNAKCVNYFLHVYV